jgi:hypothetical protein
MPMLRNEMEYEAALQDALRRLEAQPTYGDWSDPALDELLSAIASYRHAPESPHFTREHRDLDSLRARLDALAEPRHRAFGDSDEGIGPTLGMDVSHS